MGTTTTTEEPEGGVDCDIPDKPDDPELCGSTGVLAYTQRNNFLIWQNGRLVNKQQYDRALEITVECEGGQQFLNTPHGYVGYTGTWRKRFNVGPVEGGWKKPFIFKKVKDNENYNLYTVRIGEGGRPFYLSLSSQGTLEAKLIMNTRSRPPYWKFMPQFNDCALGTWAEWASCPDTCGSHVSTRRRQINGEYRKWETFKNGHLMSIT